LIAWESFAAITRAVAPFLIPMVVTPRLITFFPWLVLFLPRRFR
jgi:TRAP-type C4-dicarboxylate transport system permease large subunit